MPTLGLAWYESLTCERVIDAGCISGDAAKPWLSRRVSPGRVTMGSNDPKPTTFRAGRAMPEAGKPGCGPGSEPSDGG
jgi:hypothetical protein